MIPILAKIGKIAVQAIRGGLKNGIPGATAVVETIRKINGKQVNGSIDGHDAVINTKNIHSWPSIITGWIVGGAMIYLLLTGKIDKNTLMDILSQLVNALGE